MKTLYTAQATTIAGREGHSQTDDGRLSVTLSRPGSEGSGTNPEQLFAAAYGACFGGAIDAVAKKQGVNLNRIKVQADIDLNEDDNNGFSLAATLNISLEGVDNATAQQIVAKAHNVCPYSKATRGNMEVTLKVDDQTLEQAA
jgi:osmotically inducible protein OsmC